MEVFHWIGILSASLIGATVLLAFGQWLVKLLQILQWKYYGHKRIQELYDFLTYAKNNKIKSVQKYSNAKPFTKFIFVRVALFLLKKY